MDSTAVLTSQSWLDRFNNDISTRKDMAKTSTLSEALPDDFTLNQCELKDYQVSGINWMLQQYRFNLGGILADYMGLGKTMQTIGFMVASLQHSEYNLAQSPQYQRPCFLVVCPLSVVDSWVQHIEQHCPQSVTFVRYIGSQTERSETQDMMINFRGMMIDHINQMNTANDNDLGPIPTPGADHPCIDIILTTYDILISDRSFLSQFTFSSVIMDEAHRVKNSSTVLFKLFARHQPNPLPGAAPAPLQAQAQARQDVLSYHHIFLLTGTPIQNNIAELWTLLHLCAPSIFPEANESQFRLIFGIISQHNFTNSEMDPSPVIKDALDHLRSILSGLMLRRTHADVGINLPPKTSFVLFSALTSLQKKLYKSILSQNCDSLVTCLDQQSVQSKTALNASMRSLGNVFLSLRKIVNHPYLIPGTEPQPFVEGQHLINTSGKLLLLDEILSRVVPLNHRVLLFSTSTQTLDILQDYCNLQGWAISRLDGSARCRGDIVNSFQASSTSSSSSSSPSQTNQIPIFLLSTRAGGAGITITAADTVIFFDSDFNPASDLQAENRCYRIGQTKPVLSLRLVTRGSIEHLLYLKSVRKQALSDALLQEGRYSIHIGTTATSGLRDLSALTAHVPDSIIDDDDTSDLVSSNGAASIDGQSAQLTMSAPTSQTSNVTSKSLASAQQKLLSSLACVMPNPEAAGGDNNDDDTYDPDVRPTNSLLYSHDDIEWVITQGYSPSVEEENDSDIIHQARRVHHKLTNVADISPDNNGQSHAAASTTTAAGGDATVDSTDLPTMQLVKLQNIARPSDALFDPSSSDTTTQAVSLLTDIRRSDNTTATTSAMIDSDDEDSDAGGRRRRSSRGSTGGTGILSFVDLTQTTRRSTSRPRQDIYESLDAFLAYHKRQSDGNTATAKPPLGSMNALLGDLELFRTYHQENEKKCANRLIYHERRFKKWDIASYTDAVLPIDAQWGPEIIEYFRVLLYDRITNHYNPQCGPITPDTVYNCSFIPQISDVIDQVKASPQLAVTDDDNLDTQQEKCTTIQSILDLVGKTTELSVNAMKQRFHYNLNTIKDGYHVYRKQTLNQIAPLVTEILAQLSIQQLQSPQGEGNLSDSSDAPTDYEIRQQIDNRLVELQALLHGGYQSDNQFQYQFVDLPGLRAHLDALVRGHTPASSSSPPPQHQQGFYLSHPVSTINVDFIESQLRRFLHQRSDFSLSDADRDSISSRIENIILPQHVPSDDDDDDEDEFHISFDDAALHHVSGNILQPEITLGMCQVRIVARDQTFAQSPNQSPTSVNLVVSPETSSNGHTATSDSFTTTLPSGIQTRITVPFAKYRGYIMLNWVDDSGRFGSGRLLRSIARLSPVLVQAYQMAKEVGHLPLGSAVIAPVSNDVVNRELHRYFPYECGCTPPSPNATGGDGDNDGDSDTGQPPHQFGTHTHQVYICNMVAMSESDREFNLPKASQALNAVFLYAKLNNLCILTPKTGYSAARDHDNTLWYAMERMLNLCISKWKVDVFVFHYSQLLRRTWEQQLRQRQTNISSRLRLPSISTTST